MSNKKLHEEYSKFVTEIIDLDHLEKVLEKELEAKNCYYLPHRCVLKSDSTTTKLRVVFDASAKTTTGISLNECLMVGPKHQDDIFDNLILFRFFKIGMSADVTKMYRQVELSEKHRDYHRLLWRFSPKEDIQTYRMTKVTYGVASSSYHSIRSLSECVKADDTSSETSKALLRDFYVDDILTGAPSEQEVKQLQTSLINTFKKGRFELRKWTCSEPQVTLSLLSEFREANEDLELLQDTYTITPSKH